MKFTLLIYIAIILCSAHENEHSSRHPKNNQNCPLKKFYNFVGLINRPGVAGDALQYIEIVFIIKYSDKQHLRGLGQEA